MGLLKRIFRGDKADGQTQPHSSQFHESETTAHHHGSRNAPRRELVQVVLRDTMRKHGIPSDWIECRILSVVTRNHLSGMHVQFIIAKGQEQLLDYVQPFQDSFWVELEKFEPRARDWLFSVAWQFDSTGSRRSMPTAGGWDGHDTQPGGDTQPPDVSDDELATDLQALYAIRDAALAQPSAAGAVRAAPASRLPGGPDRD